MIREQIDVMIMDARKKGKTDNLLVYQEIKNQFLRFKTAANAKDLDDKAEISILKKMIKERIDAKDIYEQNGRKDLANKEALEADIIQKLVPKGPSEADIDNAINDFINENNNGEKLSKAMIGNCIKVVMSTLPMADGKTVSQLVAKKTL